MQNITQGRMKEGSNLESYKGTELDYLFCEILVLYNSASVTEFLSFLKDTSVETSFFT